MSKNVVTMSVLAAATACIESHREHGFDLPPVTTAGLITTGQEMTSSASSSGTELTSGASNGTSSATSTSTEGMSSDTTVYATEGSLGNPESATSTTSELGETVGTTGNDEPSCGGIFASAKPKLAPVDIILVVDNSGSMQAENAAVQNNLNAFATSLANSGLDFQVFLISMYPQQKLGICVAPPLGKLLGCSMTPPNDSQPPYYHIERSVGSNSALDDILAEKSQWYPSMMDRLNSRKHIIIVTDDDAVFGAPGVPTPIDVAKAKAKWFHDQVKAFPGFGGQYAVHAVTGIEGASCDNIYRVGRVYAQLAMPALNERLAGVLANLCDPDFEGIFEQISQGIVDGAELPCEFALPEPPMGVEFDRDKVNVYLNPQDQAPIPLLRVDGPSECNDVPGGMGWYYDDYNSPDKILLCGAPCQAGQNDGTSISLEFGCKSYVPG